MKSSQNGLSQWDQVQESEGDARHSAFHHTHLIIAESIHPSLLILPTIDLLHQSYNGANLDVPQLIPHNSHRL